MRLCAFFQLTTVNALLFACERSQILLLVTGNQVASSQKVNLMVNAMLIMPSFAVAVYYPQVGTVAGLAGSLGTCFCIYMLPICTYLNHRWNEIKDSSKIKELIDGDILSP